MHRIIVTATVLLLASASDAGEKPASKQAPADKLAAIQRDYKEAEAAFAKAVQSLPDTPESEKKYQELAKEYEKKQTDLFESGLKIARADPKSDIALTCLEWILTIPRAYYLPPGKEAMELATQHHAANPKVGKIVAWVGYLPPPERNDSHAAAFALIKAVAEKNPDRAARGQAVMALAWEAHRKFARAEFEKAANVEELAAAAEKAFEAVLKDYTDSPRLLREGMRSLGETARQELYELRNLRIGKTAPEIEGEDVEGVKFKLSDYRGKVLVLDFWGDW